MKRLLITLPLLILLASCAPAPVSTPTPAPSATAQPTATATHMPQPSPTPASSETIESKKFRQIRLEEEDQKYYVNWVQNNEIYTIIYDAPNTKTDFVILNFSDEEIDASVENILSPGISYEMKSWLIENSGIELVYILASPKGDKYLLIGATPSEKRNWGDNYIITMYDQENGYKNIIDLESNLQNVCPLYHLDPSSITWLAGDRYLYMKCSVEFGNLILDIDKNTYYTLGFDTRCRHRVFPVFSKNGEIAIAHGMIYHTEDYLDYLEQCLRPDLDSMLNEEITTKLLNELDDKKITDTPAQLWFNYEQYRIGYEGKYYYFHEVGNGEYDNTNEGNIARFNVETGEIETIISSQDLKDQGISINQLIMYISPDGDQLLLRSVNWEHIYIYNIENKNR